MRVRLTIGRSLREYADVIVEAASEEAAAAYVQGVLDAGPFGPRAGAYCNLVDRVTWEQGDELFDERVLEDSAEAHADQDEEADVTVAEGWHAPAAAESDRAPAAAAGEYRCVDPACGQLFSATVDAEGLVMCAHCRLWFDPSRDNTAPAAAASEVQS